MELSTFEVSILLICHLVIILYYCWNALFNQPPNQNQHVNAYLAAFEYERNRIERRPAATRKRIYLYPYPTKVYERLTVLQTIMFIPLLGSFLF